MGPPATMSPQAVRAESICREQTDCLLCGSSQWSALVEAEDGDAQGLSFQVVRCERCGLCFTNPRPDPASIGQFYPPGYGPHRRRSRVRRPRLGAWARRFLSMDPERHGPPWHGQGRLLDVGCGSGSFLYRMHRRGWSTVGLDISPQAVAHVRDSLQLPALLGSLPHPSIQPESFDVLTIWQCLEHVHQPLAMLREARRALAPGGRLYVTVPNIDSAAFRWFGPDWFGLDLPRHLVHFSPVTLRRMLEVAGFHVRACRLQRRTAWMQSSARRAVQLGKARGLLAWLPLRFMARLASWYGHLRGQSDCLLAVAEKRPS